MFRHIICHVHREINAKRSHYGSFFARKTTAIVLSLYYHLAILDIETLLNLLDMTAVEVEDACFLFSV